MHAIRSRPVCRARNPFSPSAALWQHFVAPAPSLPQHAHTPGRRPAALQAVRDVDVDVDVDPAPASFRRVSLGHGGQKSQPTLRRKAGHPPAELLLSEAQAAFRAEQDYVGVVVLPVSNAPARESQLPWVVRNRDIVKSGQDRLNLEIQKFHNFIQPSQAETVARKHVIEQVRQHVQNILPGYALEVFGSQRTGLAFAASDVDLRLVPVHVLTDAALAKMPPSSTERSGRFVDLRALFKALRRRHGKDYLLPVLRWARYPLISLHDRASGLDIQLVLSNDTSVSREYMQRYMREYPYLPRLYSTLKASLDVRGLSDVFRGGIGSYSLFMMIVASLKHKPHPRNDAAGALIHFLDFWVHLKAELHGVSIDPPELFSKSEQVVMHRKALAHVAEGKVPPLPQWMLTLRDPADETNDLGRKTVAWKHVRATWKLLLDQLRVDMQANTRASLLARLVGPAYTLQRTQRKRLAAYGQSLAEAGRLHGLARQSGPLTGMEAGVGAYPASADGQTSDLDQLVAIAQTIRNGEPVASEPVASEPVASEPVASEPVASESEVMVGTDEEHEGWQPWLTDVAKKSDHKNTGDAFSGLLGLDKSFATRRQEE